MRNKHLATFTQNLKVIETTGFFSPIYFVGAPIFLPQHWRLLGPERLMPLKLFGMNKFKKMVPETSYISWFSHFPNYSPRWVQMPKRTSHSGFCTRSASACGSLSFDISTFCSASISSAVRWRTNKGLPRHLIAMFFPSGMSSSLISILARARTSAEAERLEISSDTRTLDPYSPVTAPPAQIWLKFVNHKMTLAYSICLPSYMLHLLHKYL